MENFRQEVQIMRTLIVQAGFIFLIAVSARAIDDADVSSLVSESLYTYNQYEKIIGEMKAATSDLDKRLQQIREKINWFKQPAFDDERIRGINSNITFARNQIAQIEALIEVAKITDPKERAKLVDKYEADRKRILAEEMEAGKPFRKRIDKLKQEVKDKQKPFDKAMKSYCLLPGSNYPAVASTSVSSTYHTGTLTYKWLDSDNKSLAGAWISLKDKPVIKDNAEMLDDTFYVSSHSSISIKVWVGHFYVNFWVDKPEWREKERIAELIKDFVDLEGLAKIDPTRSDNSLNALAMGSLACSKRYRIIAKEWEDATKQLMAERVKVKMLKMRLGKPPADSEQLNKDRNLIDFYKKELKSNQNRLEVGMVTNPNERTARIVKLEAEKKKLDAERKKIAKPYDDRIKKLKSGLKDKGAALNDAMKRYLLTGGDAYPDINEISAKTTFYMGRISCSWKDADGNELCYARLSLRNNPAIPEDARMLDGLYYIDVSAGNVIRVWVGNFQVYFDVKKKEWQGKEDIGKALKQFIDIAGLAKIN